MRLRLCQERIGTLTAPHMTAGPVQYALAGMYARSSDGRRPGFPQSPRDFPQQEGKGKGFGREG